MSTLIIDTETSDRYFFHLEPDHDDQPHLIELCAMDERGQTLVNTLVKLPDSAEINPQAAAVNGITREMLDRDGITRAEALDQFAKACAGAEHWVAFSAKFDFGVINAACLRAGVENPLANVPLTDVMLKMTPVCKLPGPYGWKWPKLTEAFAFAFPDEEMPKSHAAGMDAWMTWRLWKWLQKHG